MDNNIITVHGQILFDPPNVTEKHKKQGEWKKVAILQIGSDLEKYYGWFIKKRYDIGLTTTLRSAHVTFINDTFNTIHGSNKLVKELHWKSVKTKWDGKEVNIQLNISPRTDGDYWWLNVYSESKNPLQDIREELGLGLPYFGMHMTIGRPIDKYEGGQLDHSGKKIKKTNISQAKYIHELIKKGFL